ncbi:MAG: hypothetical protein AABX51_02165 [Nanoarchaeota archaeon]
MTDLYEHEEQTRDAFARVKQDIYELQGRIDSAKIRLESVTTSLDQFTDKKEFYTFVEAVRAELDKLEQTLATKKDFDSLKVDIDKSKTSIDNSISSLSKKSEQSNKSLSERASSIEKRLRDNINGEEEARQKSVSAVKESLKSEVAKLSNDISHLESFNSKSFLSIQKSVSEVRIASKEDLVKLREEDIANEKVLSGRIKSLEKNQESIHDQLRELRKELKLKERKLSRYKEPGKKVFPWKPLIMVLFLLLMAWIALTFFSTLMPPSGNQTNLSQYSAQQIKEDKCLVEFECKESSPDTFYANCLYDASLDNCRCDTVDDENNCNLDEKVAAQKRLSATPSSKGGSKIVWVLVAIVGFLFFLWIAGRKPK